MNEPGNRDPLTHALRVLAGIRCEGCGGSKKSRQSFCFRCCYSLPKPMRTALYTTGSGYLPAYTAALNHLRPTQTLPPEPKESDASQPQPELPAMQQIMARTAAPKPQKPHTSTDEKATETAD